MSNGHAPASSNPNTTTTTSSATSIVPSSSSSIVPSSQQQQQTQQNNNTTLPQHKFLAGCTFYILNYEQSEATILKTHLKKLGALVLSMYKSTCTHVISAFQDGETFQQAVADGKVIVTSQWLEDCYLMHGVIPLRETDAATISKTAPYAFLKFKHPIYYPLKSKKGIPEFKRFVFSMSGFKKEKKRLMYLLMAAGAKVTPSLSQTNTHLLYKEAQGEKYVMAEKWGIKRVSQEWLFACIELWRVVPESDFVKPTSSSSSEDDLAATTAAAEGAEGAKALGVKRLRSPDEVLGIKRPRTSDDVVVEEKNPKKRKLILETLAATTSGDGQAAGYPGFIPLNSRTGLLYDARMCLHEGATPEVPERLSYIWNQLEISQLANRCHIMPSREATVEELSLVHPQEYVMNFFNENSRASINKKKKQRNIKQGSIEDPHHEDIHVNEYSLKASRLAAGGVVKLTELVCTSQLDNGFAIIRPPGHHAEKEEAMGFCIFNNVAVAARVAQKKFNMQRVLIVDFDIHHGNGIQQIFEDDPSIMYISIHRYEEEFYPGTGTAQETGAGKAKGLNLNIPLPPVGMSVPSNTTFNDADYMAIFNHVVIPVASEFQADLVLVAAGFDAAKGDTLGRNKMVLTPNGFANMVALLKTVSKGKIVLALEGGYNVDVTSKCVNACLQVLLGEYPPPVSTKLASSITVAAIKKVIDEHKQIWKCLQLYDTVVSAAEPQPTPAPVPPVQAPVPVAPATAPTSALKPAPATPTQTATPGPSIVPIVTGGITKVVIQQPAQPPPATTVVLPQVVPVKPATETFTKTVIVDVSGTGDFLTIQEAIEVCNSLGQKGGAAAATGQVFQIAVKPGVYLEKLVFVNNSKAEYKIVLTPHVERASGGSTALENLVFVEGVQVVLSVDGAWVEIRSITFSRTNLMTTPSRGNMVVVKNVKRADRCVFLNCNFQGLTVAVDQKSFMSMFKCSILMAHVGLMLKEESTAIIEQACINLCESGIALSDQSNIQMKYSSVIKSSHVGVLSVRGKGSIENSTIAFHPSGINIVGGSLSIIKCKIYKQSQAGIVLNEKNSSLLEGNDIFDNKFAGIEFCSNGTIIKNNIIRNGLQSGILVIKEARGRIEGNEIYNNGFAGIEVKAGSPVITGNKIHSQKQAGIGIFGAQSRPEITNNEIHHNNYSGIEVKDHSDPIIKYNQIHHQKQHGILTLDFGKGYIEANKIHDNAYDGIRQQAQSFPTIKANEVFGNLETASRINIQHR